jgi:deazaflavin-dependent oxidoreductase (nitroreductase family)
MDVNARPGHRDPEATEKRMANEHLIKALDAAREIQITVTGRKTGRPITLPVWFVRDGDRLYLVPLKGADADWYKNVLKEPAIRLAAGGAQVTARATPVTDPARVGEIVDMFRAKYGAENVAAYYPKHDVAVEVRSAERTGAAGREPA